MNDQERPITEAGYRAWVGQRMPELAGELTAALPQDVRDAGIRFEWASDAVRAAVRGSIEDVPGNAVQAASAVIGHGIALPCWPDGTPWTPFRNRIPRATKCYRMAGGAMVHVKPDCQCPR